MWIHLMFIKQHPDRIHCIRMARREYHMHIFGIVNITVILVVCVCVCECAAWTKHQQQLWHGIRTGKISLRSFQASLTSSSILLLLHSSVVNTAAKASNLFLGFFFYFRCCWCCCLLAQMECVQYCGCISHYSWHIKTYNVDKLKLDAKFSWNNS